MNVHENDRLRKALADLIEDAFGPEREVGEPVPESTNLWDLTTEAWLAKEAKYRSALKSI